MARLSHGAHVTTGAIEDAAARLSDATREIPLAFTVVQPLALDRFDFLFPALQADPDCLLRDDPSTFMTLVNLGRTMHRHGPAGPADAGDSEIPAAYIYFGQFIDHDIILEALSATLPDLNDPNLAPMAVPMIRQILRNGRRARLNLDNVYSAPAPRDPADQNRMLIGFVSPTGSNDPPLCRPPGKSDDNDVPREAPSGDPHYDRTARIGDPRNDENTVVAQLQVAFLKAHNALVDQGHGFGDAQRILRQHYQHLIVHDYLPRICDPRVVDDVLKNGPKAYDPTPFNSFMPLEFSVATFRFGHTMVRDSYNFNVNFNRRGGMPVTLAMLFSFNALSGQLADSDTLPENWILEWQNLVDAGGPFDKASRFDTTLVEPLFELRRATGTAETGDLARLAVRNLLRGYLLRMPTGQAVAQVLNLPTLTHRQLSESAANAEQAEALLAGGFLDRTPLWYYVLAEASVHGGQHLGPVGSTVVADVLIGLVRRSDDSILSLPEWRPTLPSANPGSFDLRDLLAFAGVLPWLQTSPQPSPRTYTVEAGDSLLGIAESELGDPNRWPQVFALNRQRIVDPDLIFPGQELVLPDTGPTKFIPLVHRVIAGDTLSGIARAKLGDADRWPEVFAMNRTIINNPDTIFAGQVLLLPAS